MGMVDPLVLIGIALVVLLAVTGAVLTLARLKRRRLERDGSPADQYQRHLAAIRSTERRSQTWRSRRYGEGGTDDAPGGGYH
jgi:hypothetical protein